ncbi:hypothetical protein CR203_03435 [Salipaludibacillus neizhouensis]|uniref:Gfo/Idh/MocA-like oxidoreductase N-terminal domain-containing protein n=1 Tax=Salipaludibacillus neizhouensis TaxID=885475 RepID=A0A3A9KHR2_9BACI|nr:Gfo/Idh/MocA family oxidoreductase [Salipaludibacillus neizhouensis]RKL69103.1 hypothetical protein CR203_03435 [Salipaludibacillus neizhouensis]
MVMKVGIVGFNESNGHPFSFSAIINGYRPNAISNAGWRVIQKYLDLRDQSEFGFEGINITHAWTQDTAFTKELCYACKIPNPLSKITNMLEEVDAVIIARDDYQSHKGLASLFLEQDIPTFIDKPLSLKEKELTYFKPYLKTGKLMSCSAMRFAKELDRFHRDPSLYGNLYLIRAIGPLSWEKYGIHFLEAIIPFLSTEPHSVKSLTTKYDSMVISLKDNTLFQVNTAKEQTHNFLPFFIDFCGSKAYSQVTVGDNFSMFRRTLWYFFQSVKTKTPAIAPDSTLMLMKVLIAGQRSKLENREVFIDEVII